MNPLEGVNARTAWPVTRMSAGNASPGAASRQRGFGLIAYLIIGAVALGIGTTVVLTYKSAITRAEKAEAELVACADKYEQALASIAKQNAAIGEWEKAAAEASAKAKAARKEADKAHVATQSERERLKRAQAEFKATGTCPAGQAVQEIRKGLRP